MDAAFVCRMEAVLEVYRRVPEPSHPVVCVDEASVQRVKEVRAPIPAQPGHSERYDVEYERNGVAHLLAFHAPFENWRRVDVADNYVAKQWAEGIRRLIQDDYPQAQRITLVMDNPNTHVGASLYKAFQPALARALLDKLEFVYTPKHGSRLDIAQCELSVLTRQCLDRRLPDIATVISEIAAWTITRNQSKKPVDWHFTTDNARINLKCLYPKLSD